MVEDAVAEDAMVEDTIVEYVLVEDTVVEVALDETMEGGAAEEEVLRKPRR